MGGMTIRIVSIEPPWFEEKAQVQSCTWRELNQGHIPQEIVDAITPEFALKLTRSHAKDPNQVVLVALENNHVIGLLSFCKRRVRQSNGPRLRNWLRYMCWNLAIVMVLAVLWLRRANAPSATIGFALWVAGFNTNAQGFYRHIGFHETGLTQTEDMGPELEMINYSDGVFQ